LNVLEAGVSRFTDCGRSVGLAEGLGEAAVAEGVEVLGPEGEAVCGHGVFGVEQALDGAGEGGVLPVVEGKLGGLEAEGGVEVGGVGGEEVVDGGLWLMRAEPCGNEVMLGGQI
jgi:hypothetical protein